MSQRRLIPAFRYVVLSSKEKPCNQAMHHNRQMATSLLTESKSAPAEKGDTNAGCETAKGYAFATTIHMQNRCPGSPNVRAPEVPNLRAPDVCASGSGYGRWESMAGNIKSGTFHVGHVSQSEDLESMRRASNDLEEKHPKANACILTQSLHFRGANASPDSQAVNANALSREPIALARGRGALHQNLIHDREVNADTMNQHTTARQLDTGSYSSACAANHGLHNESGVGTLLYDKADGEILESIKSMEKGKSPSQIGITSSSKEYIISKARVHASLWQQEINKLGGKDKEDADFGTSGSSIFSPQSGDEHGSVGFKVKNGMPDGWETFDPPDGEFYDDSLAKEEAMMFEEFERRRERNRILIAGFVKKHMYGRRRPVEGWKHIINSFGIQSKGATDLALEGGGGQTRESELEKLAQKQERRRMVQKR